MAAKRQNSRLDDGRWVQFAQTHMASRSSLEKEYAALQEVPGTYGDAIQLVPTLRVRRFADSIEVIAGAKVTQFDAQRRIEGQCQLSYADMDMLMGTPALPNDVEVDRPDRASTATKHGFECHWYVKWNRPEDVSVGINSRRFVTLERWQLTGTLGACQEFVRNTFS